MTSSEIGLSKLSPRFRSCAAQGGFACFRGQQQHPAPGCDPTLGTSVFNSANNRDVERNLYFSASRDGDKQVTVGVY